RPRAERRVRGQDIQAVREAATVSVHARERVPGMPLDRMFALYLLTAIPALAFAHRPATWPLLLALHAFAVLLLWPMPVIGQVMDGAKPDVRRGVRTLLDWAPLLLMPLLYTELAVLNSAIYGGTYFDELIIGWEQTLFGGQPSRGWAAAAPLLWLSEALHAAYLSYYFIIFVPPVLLFRRRDRAEFRAAVFTLMLAFFAHYLFFIYFPVQGPRYLFPAPGGELANGYFYQLAHRILEAGSAQ